MRYFQPAADIFQSKSNITFIQFFKIRLNNSAAIVMDTQEKGTVMIILSKMNKT